MAGRASAGQAHPGALRSRQTHTSCHDRVPSRWTAYPRQRQVARSLRGKLHHPAGHYAQRPTASVPHGFLSHRWPWTQDARNKGRLSRGTLPVSSPALRQRRSHHRRQLSVEFRTNGFKRRQGEGRSVFVRVSSTIRSMLVRTYTQSPAESRLDMVNQLEQSLLVM